MAPGLEKSAIWSIWEDNIAVLLAWCVSSQTSCFSLPIKNLLKGQTRIHVFVLGGGERGLWIVLLYIHYYFMLFLYSVNVDSLQNVVSVVLCTWKIFSQWFCAIRVPFFSIYLYFFARNELYSKRRDRFEEECKKQLVGNIVLTRLVTALYCLYMFSFLFRGS